MKKAALITGAAARLGKATALHFAANGYDIALHYNTSQKEAEETANEIRELGAACQLLQADLADNANYELLIEKAAKAFPALSVLVNNASVFDRGGFLESDQALFAKVQQTNFTAPVFLTQAFAKRQKKGCVVNLLDTMVSQYRHAHFFYLLSKKSLLEFTKMAAVELAPDICVNGVCPGYILPAPGYDRAFQQKLEARLPLGKIATPEDIAQAVFLMVSNPALTGQVLFVDGGESLL